MTWPTLPGSRAAPTTATARGLSSGESGTLRPASPERTNPLPQPGRLLGVDDFLTLVVPTLQAHPMRKLRLVALRADRAGRSVDGVSGPAGVTHGARGLPLGYGHSYLLVRSRGQRGAFTSASASGRTAVHYNTRFCPKVRPCGTSLPVGRKQVLQRGERAVGTGLRVRFTRAFVPVQVAATGGTDAATRFIVHGSEGHLDT
jgi:hypothetical protein